MPPCAGMGWAVTADKLVPCLTQMTNGYASELRTLLPYSDIRCSRQPVQISVSLGGSFSGTTLVHRSVTSS